MLLCDWRIFCFGRQSLELYAEIHQTTGNQLIHGLGMPIVGYGVFGGIPLLLSNKRFDQEVLRLFIYCAYIVYYWWGCNDWVGAFVTAATYLPALHYASTHVEDGVGVLGFTMAALGSIAVQEIVGHGMYERVASDLWQLPNSIAIAPLFGTRALMHVFFGAPLVPQ